MSDLKPPVFTEIHNQANRLTSAVRTAGYRYNADGLRMGKTVAPEGGPSRPWKTLVLRLRLPSPRVDGISLGRERHDEVGSRSRVYARKATNVWPGPPPRPGHRPGSLTGATGRPKRDIQRAHAEHCCRPRRHELWSISSP